MSAGDVAAFLLDYDEPPSVSAGNAADFIIMNSENEFEEPVGTEQVQGLEESASDPVEDLRELLAGLGYESNTGGVASSLQTTSRPVQSQAEMMKSIGDGISLGKTNTPYRKLPLQLRLSEKQ